MERKFDISDFFEIETEHSITVKIVENEKRYRKALKISQKQLAIKSGVSYASIRRFENTGEISLTSLLKIARALDCLDDFKDLFKNFPIADLKDYKV